MTEDVLEVAVAELRPSLEALLMIADQPLDEATLAVAAYKQPVSRARVSAIRGVNVDGVMRTLVTRGLVEEAGEDHSTGAHLYRATSCFLERIGVTSLDDLPELARDEDGLVRLHKLLARSGVASRRKCEELMLAGEVTVDGEVVTRLGTKIAPATAVIRVSGKRLPPVSAHVYLVLNKPRGVVSTMSDPEGRRTLSD